MQVFVEEQLGEFLGMGFGGDAGADSVGTFGTAIERRREDPVAGCGQARSYVLPDPAALICAVDEYECCHWLFPLAREHSPR
jgi:hypothetical protein